MTFNRPQQRGLKPRVFLEVSSKNQDHGIQLVETAQKATQNQKNMLLCVFSCFGVFAMAFFWSERRKRRWVGQARLGCAWLWGSWHWNTLHFFPPSWPWLDRLSYVAIICYLSLHPKKPIWSGGETNVAAESLTIQKLPLGESNWAAASS